MDYLNKVKGWAKGIADVGVSFIALNRFRNPFQWSRYSVLAKCFRDRKRPGRTARILRSRFDRFSCSLDFISYLQQKII